MLRYIHIGNQICEDPNDFAWFDTVTDRFHMFNGTHVWSSWEDFVFDYNLERGGAGLDRYRRLYPKEKHND